MNNFTNTRKLPSIQKDQRKLVTTAGSTGNYSHTVGSKRGKSGTAAGLPSSFISNNTARNKQTSVNLRIIDNLNRNAPGQSSGLFNANGSKLDNFDKEVEINEIRNDLKKNFSYSKLQTKSKLKSGGDGNVLICSPPPFNRFVKDKTVLNYRSPRD